MYAVNIFEAAYSITCVPTVRSPRGIFLVVKLGRATAKRGTEHLRYCRQAQSSLPLGSELEWNGLGATRAKHKHTNQTWVNETELIIWLN